MESQQDNLQSFLIWTVVERVERNTQIYKITITQQNIEALIHDSLACFQFRNYILAEKEKKGDYK